jgi:hypothetical protein
MVCVHCAAVVAWWRGGSVAAILSFARQEHGWLGWHSSTRSLRAVTARAASLAARRAAPGSTSGGRRSP